ncbi:MAG TPA: 3-hydroxyacyl-CoA dehydrogenase family protein, partial [Chryseosolibacter sp.]
MQTPENINTTTPQDPGTLSVGVVGLGLMGCSIATCLLMAGHPVVAIAPIASDLEHAEKRIREHLLKSGKEGLTDKTPEMLLGSLSITVDYSALVDCGLVIECTLEDRDVKKTVFEKIEAVIKADALLTSNTSAIPITILQKLTQHPTRFFGLHWAEPSHTTRFLEIICGDLSDVTKGEYLYALSQGWGKEPTLVRKDIRGFITNRLMYAMYREAFYLVENGYA